MKYILDEFSNLILLLSNLMKGIYIFFSIQLPCRHNMRDILRNVNLLRSITLWRNTVPKSSQLGSPFLQLLVNERCFIVHDTIQYLKDTRNKSCNNNVEKERQTKNKILSETETIVTKTMKWSTETEIFENLQEDGENYYLDWRCASSYMLSAFSNYFD